MKVAYLGPKGSFTHTAAKDYFITEELVSYGTIPACLKAVQHNQVDLGIIPIENTIEGTVNQTLDHLYHKASLSVVGELVMPISQQLLVKNNQTGDLRKIEKIYSHPQALAQCQEFISEHLPKAKVIATDSTSLAAKYIAENAADNLAAIGPAMCGIEYDLKVLKADIQDIPHNKTRFWIVSLTSEAETTQAGKASLCITMPNNLPGALQKALTTFSWRGINLSKIESRPLKTELGEYFFLIDTVFESNQKELLLNAIAEIISLGGEVKALGIYPVKLLNPL